MVKKTKESVLAAIETLTNALDLDIEDTKGWTLDDGVEVVEAIEKLAMLLMVVATVTAPEGMIEIDRRRRER